mmetsp:Transcript_28760/g.45285  ORF Transcript_28760/g.45285 Transcript_28760/m.45285 type:complete len:676 (+) Transcript_28760:24-2051(+)
MLGRVLTEEEERQRRQADVAAPAEANSSHAVEQHDVGVVVAAAPTQDAAYLGSSPGYGSVSSFGRYAAEGEDHDQADYEEYTDYDGSENDDASFESYDNNDDASSGDEDSYLLHPNNNRRRKRKGSRRELQNQSSFYQWKKSFKKATRKLARKIRAVAVIIADVDNVWDSPENSVGSSNSNRSRRANNNNGGNNARSSVYDVITGGTSTIRNRTAAIFWFVVLSVSYASERSTFKIMVDRVGPFRLFSAEVILGMHVIFSSFAIIFWNIFWNKDEQGSSYGSGFGLGLPLADVGLMAILDTVYLLVGVISGAHVPPVLTVILVQAVIPLTACFTQCVHPDGYCYGYCFPSESNESTLEYSVNDGSEYYHNDDTSTVFDSRSNHTRSTHTNIRINNHSYAEVSTIPNLPQPSTMPDPVAGWGGLSKYHLIGTGLMFVAIFMGLTPALLSLDQIIITEHDAMPEKTAYNTIVFCFAAIPAAISQLYKERTMIRLKQPIDRNKLNLVLSIFQLLFAVVVSPLAYGLQGMGAGSGWTAQYPSTEISQNFSDGFHCFLGILDKETQATGYPEDARCQYAWELVVLHVISILLVGVACDKLAAATKIMYRGVSMGIMVAVIFMFIYQIRDKWCEYGPIVSFFHLTSTAVLIVGADIYHRVSLADASFDTEYPEIGDLYEDE